MISREVGLRAWVLRVLGVGTLAELVCCLDDGRVNAALNRPCAGLGWRFVVAYLVVSRVVVGLVLGVVLALLSLDLAGAVSFGALGGVTFGLVELARAKVFPELRVSRPWARFAVRMATYWVPSWVALSVTYTAIGMPKAPLVCLAWTVPFVFVLGNRLWWRELSDDVRVQPERYWSPPDSIVGAIRGTITVGIIVSVLVLVVENWVDPEFSAWLSSEPLLPALSSLPTGPRVILDGWVRFGVLVGAPIGFVAYALRPSQAVPDEMRPASVHLRSALRAGLFAFIVCLPVQSLVLFVIGAGALELVQWAARTALATAIAATLYHGLTDLIFLFTVRAFYWFGWRVPVRLLAARRALEQPTALEPGTPRAQGLLAALGITVILVSIAVPAVWTPRSYGKAPSKTTDATPLAPSLSLSIPPHSSAVNVTAFGTIHLGHFYGRSSVLGIDVGFAGYPHFDVYDVCKDARHASIIYRINNGSWQPLFPVKGVLVPWWPRTERCTVALPDSASSITFLVNDRQPENNLGAYWLTCAFQ